MTFPRFPGPESPYCVFWQDYEALDAAGTRWRDRAGYGLDALPQAGFAAPNYGLARAVNGQGYCTFSGAANVYGTQALAFYAAATVVAAVPMTMVAVLTHTTPVIGNAIWSCRNAGATRGALLTYSTTERMVLTAYDAGGVASTLVDAADANLTSRTRVSIYAMDKALGTGYIWHDGQQRAATFAGNVNPVAYDATVAPTLGAVTGGGSRFVGRQYAVIVYVGWLPSNSEAGSMSAYWLDRMCL